MAQQTEAACLLETGAMYGKRLLLCPPSGVPIFAGFRPGVFSLYFGDAPIYHFDGEGRWQRAFVAGTHYLKGLDAAVQAIDRVREGGNLVLKRRTLGFAEASDLDAQVRAAALDIIDALGTGRLAFQSPPGPTPALSDAELREVLEQVTRWDAAAWFAQRERYLDTYGPLPLLPPDSAQSALVLQATLGNAAGIAFGGGAVTEHAVRSPEEFATHARAVRTLLGRRLAQCRTVFLAGSDVLRQGPEIVEGYLQAISATFPIDPNSARRQGSSPLDSETTLVGIDALLDDFTSPTPGWPDWKRLHARLLRRVSLGVESGAAEIRALYGKDWENGDLRGLVAQLKDAGVGVGVVVLVDSGGIENAARHLAATEALVNELELGAGDLVTLLDANEVRDPALDAAALGFTPLTGPRWAEQQSELRRLLLPVRNERKAKVAPYSLGKQGG
jgi:hypothetical protein